jgi:hypothetical protein
VVVQLARNKAGLDLVTSPDGVDAVLGAVVERAIPIPLVKD